MRSFSWFLSPFAGTIGAAKAPNGGPRQNRWVSHACVKGCDEPCVRGHRCARILQWTLGASCVRSLTIEMKETGLADDPLTPRCSLRPRAVSAIRAATPRKSEARSLKLLRSCSKKDAGDRILAAPVLWLSRSGQWKVGPIQQRARWTQ